MSDAGPGRAEGWKSSFLVPVFSLKSILKIIQSGNIKLRSPYAHSLTGFKLCNKEKKCKSYLNIMIQINSRNLFVIEVNSNKLLSDPRVRLFKTHFCTKLSHRSYHK